MAGLAHDGEFASAIQVPLRSQSGTQGVASILGRIEPGGFGRAFYDEPDGIFVQAKRTEAAVAIDAAE